MINSIESDIIGSAFYALPIGAQSKIEFKSNELIISCAPGLEEHIHYAEILEFNIYGPGKIVSGGGFVGGGYGAEGALLGIAASAILNAATTKSAIQTFISVITLKGELHFLCKSHEPYILRIGLSRVYAIMRHLDTKKIRDYFENLDSLIQTNSVSQESANKIKSEFSRKHNFLPTHGYLISSINHGFSAYKAGILVDDLLIKYNTIEITTDNDLSNAIKNATEHNCLLIVRNGTLITINCEPGRLGIDGRIV